ncbi:hypothetical protein RJ639_003412 [Escallonia herrerae]|uniref:Germin-like protein n=1 Tax=Escallonia herrerae TaxID=1293975 RepID=A0AA88W3B7_9ASTE|nr:hypothetical protein RJ639_003412 [Escallonia herrerae]
MHAHLAGSAPLEHQQHGQLALSSATFALLFLATVLARDPNLVIDFVGPNVSTAFPGSYFTYTGLRGGAPPPAHGTTDSSGQLYKNVLQKYDVFLFPEGLPHYEANLIKGEKEVVVMMFGSADAGFVSLAQSLFGSGISDEVLVKTLKIRVIFTNLDLSGNPPLIPILPGTSDAVKRNLELYSCICRRRPVNGSDLDLIPLVFESICSNMVRFFDRKPNPGLGLLIDK